MNYAGLALIILGALLVVAEAFVPSFGALGVGGLIAFIIGSIMLFDTSVPGFAIAVPIIAAIASVAGLVLIGMVWLFGRARRRPVVTGVEHILGSHAEVLDGFESHGTVRLGGELWNARSSAPVSAGQEVRVVKVEGLLLWVEPVKHRGAKTMSPFLLVVVFLVGALLFSAIKILKEYERGVMFTLGRFTGVKGPGIILVVPIVQQIVKVDLRVIVLDVPKQDVISRDNVSVKVNAVVYFRVVDPSKAIIQVANPWEATSQFAQTTLRSVLGQHDLDEMLSQREKLNIDIQRILDQATDAWGIKVANVEIKHVDLDESMIRAIAKQAEAERTRRAKIIHAEGESQAAQMLVQAAHALAAEPAAMQLRYLQTLADISNEKSSTIVFPLPLDLIAPLLGAKTER